MKLTIRQIADSQKISISELATKANIDPDHLQRVSDGKVRMTAEELVKLSKLTKIDPEDFRIE